MTSPAPVSHLEIGGGLRPRPGYANLDPHHGAPGLRCLVQDGIPLPDASVQTAYASHVMEHIPQGQPRIDTLNEIHRVLVRGGTFEIVVPCIGFTDHGDIDHRPARPAGTTGSGQAHHNGWQGYADPTHVSFWWYPESFWYLGRSDFSANADYGLRRWTLGEMYLADLWEAHVTLVKQT